MSKLIVQIKLLKAVQKTSVKIPHVRQKLDNYLKHMFSIIEVIERNKSLNILQKISKFKAKTATRS